MGLPTEVLAELESADERAAKGFEVWPGNIAIVDAFLAVATQWRTTSLADGRVLWTGLDYTSVRARLAGEVALTPSLWHGLGVIERSAAHVLNGGMG